MKVKKAIVLLFIGLLMSFGSNGVAVASTTNEYTTNNASNYTPDNGYTPLLAYIVNDGHRTYFDSERAIADGASEELIKVGDFINLYSFAMQSDKNDRISLPLWGNWCGPGHSGPGAPQDLLDTACMHHDKCYGNKGYFNCACDQALIDEINRNYSHMKTAEKNRRSSSSSLFHSAKSLVQKLGVHDEK